MTNVFTLDDLNKALDTKYAPFVFQAGKEKFNLKQVLRLPKTSRDQVKILIDSLDTADKEELTEEGMFAILGEIIKIVCDKGDRLLEILDNDVVSLTALFEAWVGSAQPGEASPSPV